MKRIFIGRAIAILIVVAVSFGWWAWREEKRLQIETSVRLLYDSIQGGRYPEDLLTEKSIEMYREAEADFGPVDSSEWPAVDIQALGFRAFIVVSTKRRGRHFAEALKTTDDDRLILLVVKPEQAEQGTQPPP